MSTSSLPDGDAQTSAIYHDCTPAEDYDDAIEKSDLTVRRFWEFLSEARTLEQIMVAVKSDKEASQTRPSVAVAL
jgi:hypothetical protein